MASGNIPATGVQTTPGPNGSVPIRREIRDLQANAKDQFNLYLLGLRELQKTPPSDSLSYYQIAGIHGEPFVAWNDVQGNPDATFGGYCTHSSILFVTWHRPYLALYEQALYAKVQQVASSYTDPQLRQKYMKAAQSFRLPYWDWAAPAGPQGAFPRSIAAAQISVVDTDGVTRPIDNPLARFVFRGLNIPAELELDSNWSRFSATQRSPNVSRNIANENASLRNNVSILLLSYKLFDAFSNTAWSRNGQAGDYGSVENIHDNIHGVTGGHMGSLAVSAFDPVFWMHHANVDRLWAIWQALNPSAFTINKVAGDLSPVEDNFFITQGEQLSASTPLKPFWDASGTEFWTSTDAKDTAHFGYAYPETQIWNYPTPQQYQAAVRASVVALYGANVISNFFGSVDIAAVKKGAPAAPLPAPVAEPADHPILTTQFKKKAVAAEPEAASNPSNPASAPKELTPEPVPAPIPTPLVTPQNPLGVPDEYAHVFTDNKYTEWITNLRAIKHGLAQSFQVFVFLGDFDPSPASWPGEPNMVGRFTVLGRGPSTSCSKCQTDQEGGLVVTGTVPLTAALLTEVVRGRLSGLNNHDEVVEYLKKNLHWRVTGYDGAEIQRSEVPGLKVGVVSTRVTVGEDGVPEYEDEYRVHEGVTDGRPAGLCGDDEV